MRISDWSADVCSSDLFGMRGGEPRPARQRRAVDREQRAPLGAEREPGGFEHEARHRQRIERERCALAIDQQPPRPVPDAARSEEHTSELQSLMLISYAVFCLKQKNTPPTSIKNKRKNYH